ncbi:hypothetical protein CTAYLR_004674 [Chrysophaeum taylorii]|uniref:C2 domain-containing protein n=1 Tax=Chrysophaeum taylorii TaxID=2483200 RepID=A0AAD7XHI1_9STRA|nr:hypothetical protein CTAYLR_004674 [Chrysophaeum taylorii]
MMRRFFFRRPSTNNNEEEDLGAALLPEEECEEEEEEGLPRTALKVVVIRARKLKAMDRAGLRGAASSDPYAVCGVEGEERRTRVIKRSLEPVWLERLEIPADDPSASLVVVVKDSDYASSDDEIGRCEIPLAHLSHGGAVRAWHALAGAGGEIELCIRWCHNPSYVYDVPREFWGDESSSTDNNELRVFLIRIKGRLVVAKDRFVSVRYADQTFKSKKTNPTMMEKFVFAAEDARQKLEIVVADGNNNFFVGRCAIEITRRGRHILDLATGIRVELALCWVRNPDRVVDVVGVPEVDDDDDAVDETPNELVVCVLRARRLRAMDTNILFGGSASSDPYVVLAIDDDDDRRRTTTVKRETLDPVWQETFALPCDGEALAVTVFDHDDASADDLIGRTVLETHPFRRKRVRNWVELEGRKPGCCGEIEIAALWRYNPDRVLELPDKMRMEHEQQDLPNVVLCAIIRARAPHDSDRDAYCLASLDGEERRSKNTTAARVWLEVLELPCELPSSRLLLSLVAKKRYASKDEVIGSCDVEIDDSLRYAPRREWRKFGEKRAVELAVRWVYEPSYVVPVPEAVTDPDPSKPGNELVVCAIRFKNKKAAAQKKKMKENAFDVELRFGTFEPQRTNKPGDILRFPLDYLEGVEPLTLALVGRHGEPLRAEIFLSVATLVDRFVQRSWVTLSSWAMIEVAVLWAHNPERVCHLPPHMVNEDDDISKPPNALCVCLVRGRDLPLSKKTDHFCCCVLQVLNGAAGNVVEYKSRVHRNTANPDFGCEYFEFPAEQDEKPIEFRVELRDASSSSSSSSIGSFELVLSHKHHRGQTFRCWHAAGAFAKLDVAILWRHNPEFALATPQIIAAAEPFPDLPANQLRVGVLRAKNLVEGRRVYAAVRVGDERAQTSKKKNTRYPIWMEAFKLRVPPKDARRSLEVALLNAADTFGPPVPLGRFELPLSKRTYRRPYRGWHELRGGGGGQQVEIALRLVFDPDAEGVAYDPRKPEDMRRLADACASATRDGDLKALRALLDAGATCAHARIDDDRTPAHDAARRDGGDILLELLKDLRVDVARPDRSGTTPAHVAAAADKPVILKQLAVLGADLDAPDNHGKRPAHVACAAGAVKAIEVLLALGVSFDRQTWNGRYPAHYAAEHGRVATLDFLALRGLDVDAPGSDFGNRTPLHVAAAAGSIAAVQKLVTLGANVETRDTMGHTPAHHAAFHGREPALDLLVANGADDALPDPDGKTPQTLLRESLPPPTSERRRRRTPLRI